LEKCELCHLAGTSQNPINSHHYKGRKRYPKDVMRVHSRSCHWYSEWITSLYLLAGRETELDKKLIIYLYTRTITLMHNGEFVLPIYR